MRVQREMVGDPIKGELLIKEIELKDLTNTIIENYDVQEIDGFKVITFDRTHEYNVPEFSEITLNCGFIGLPQGHELHGADKTTIEDFVGAEVMIADHAKCIATLVDQPDLKTDGLWYFGGDWPQVKEHLQECINKLNKEGVK